MVKKRLKAFLLDYLIIIVYIGFLYGITMFLLRIFPHSLQDMKPLSEQLLGFICLTLPVILYFTISESSKYSGTVGKRVYHLKLVTKHFLEANFGQLFFRNIIKFLPWTMAHFFVFRLFEFKRSMISPPWWIFGGLILCQVIAFVYLVFLFANNNRNIYEIFSSTRVVDAAPSEAIQDN